MRRNAFYLIPIFFLTVCFIGCQQERKMTGNEPVIAAVSVEPHAFLVARIGGERVQAEVLVPPGKEPETYQIVPDKLAVLSHAQIFYRTGIPIEETLLPKLHTLSKELQIADLRSGLKIRTLELHQHASEHDHHGDSADPHIWFAPTLLKKEAETILKTLQKIDPAGSSLFQKNYENLLTEIESLRLEIEEMLKPCRGETVFVFHPAYGYFCEEFGLRQWAIEFEGKSPKPQQIAGLIEEMKKLPHPPKIFVQPEFNQSPAKAIAEATGAEVIIHSTLERDVLQGMRKFAQHITSQ